MKVLSLFSGIGAFEKALENLGIETDLVGYCEIDKYAAKSYSAIHNVSEEKNLGDITKIDAKALPRDIDLITYGFPCQDISIAGKQKGLINEDGTQTRSGLFFEALRIIEETKPKVAIAENVKNLVGKKFNAQFQVVLASLDAAGYNNYWSVLNAKNYGVPQNRERVFIVSIRKDIDRGLFQFPVPIALNKRLKDVLETVVDKKYYLSSQFVSYLERLKADCSVNGNGFAYQPTDGEGIAKTIQAKAQVRSTDTLIQVGQMYPNSGNPQAGRVYDAEGISPTMDTCSGGNRMPKVAIGSPWVSEKGVKYICSPKRGMCADINPDIAQTLTACGQANWTGSFVSPDIEMLEKDTTIGSKEPVKIKLQNGEIITSDDDTSHLRIRKLTPKECFRLMGFDDESFHKAEAVNSNSQLYKQAGNSIVVNVLEAIFRQMLDENGNFTI